MPSNHEKNDVDNIMHHKLVTNGKQSKCPGTGVGTTGPGHRKIKPVPYDPKKYERGLPNSIIGL
jgi:hypothetical protein